MNRPKEQEGPLLGGSNFEPFPQAQPPRKLSGGNYFEIVASFLFFILGLIILIRSIVETWLILGVGVGAAFLAYGIYRLWYIWKYFYF